MSWLFTEFSPAGVDLSSAAAVASYDRYQGTDPMRDRALLDRLDVGPGSHLIDYGCGTGSFVVEAARRGAEVDGVDVSEQMLELIRRRADAAGVWSTTWATSTGNGSSRKDFETHIREEFSTYAWVLEGMLDRAGFEILSSDFPRPTHREMLCRRLPDRRQ